MMLPTHTAIAFGKGGKIEVDKDHYCLNYGDWYIGINNVGLLQCTSVYDNAFLVSTSLAQVKDGGFSSGGAEPIVQQYEPIEVVRFYKRTTDASDITCATYSRRLFKVNNVAQKMSFSLTPLSGENIPETVTSYVHFSLFKAK
jgi:hypothetical protein